MQSQIFTIKSRKDLQLKVKKLSALDILSVSNTMNFNSIAQSKETMNFIIDNIEVLINGQWLLLREDEFTWWPANIEEDVIAIQETVVWFMNNVVKAAFQKSRELNQKQL